MTSPYDVFLSYSSRDRDVVVEVARWLRDENELRVFLDIWELVPGETWVTGLEDALEASKTVAIFVGPDGVGAWRDEEKELALGLVHQARSERRRVIPVLLPGVSQEEVKGFLGLRTWADLASVDGPTRLLAGIAGQRPGELAEQSSSALRARLLALHDDGAFAIDATEDAGDDPPRRPAADPPEVDTHRGTPQADAPEQATEPHPRPEKAPSSESMEVADEDPGARDSPFHDPQVVARVLDPLIKELVEQGYSPVGELMNALRIDELRERLSGEVALPSAVLAHVRTLRRSRASRRPPSALGRHLTKRVAIIATPVLVVAVVLGWLVGSSALLAGAPITFVLVLVVAWVVGRRQAAQLVPEHEETVDIAIDWLDCLGRVALHSDPSLEVSRAEQRRLERTMNQFGYRVGKRHRVLQHQLYLSLGALRDDLRKGTYSTPAMLDAARLQVKDAFLRFHEIDAMKRWRDRGRTIINNWSYSPASLEVTTTIVAQLILEKESWLPSRPTDEPS